MTREMQLPEAEADLNETLRRGLGLVVRRRWWIIGPSCLVVVATVFVLRLLPNRYQSEASLEIVQQLVSQRYVQAADTATANDVVQVMKREVLSRTRLLGIIDEFGLYAKQKQQLTPEALADLMRKDVEVEPLDQIPGRSEFSAFRISFTADTVLLAQQVTSRLASLFIEEHSKKQETEAATTSRFLETQLEAAKKHLAEQDERRRQFQAQYVGELPEQQQGNFAKMTELSTQLQSARDRIGRLDEQRNSLELSVSDKLARMQSERAALVARFTLQHPQVIKKDHEIALMLALIERLKAHTSGSGDRQTDSAPEDPTVTTLLSQAASNQRETESLGKEETQLQAEIAAYENRLNLAPVREQQLAAILRDNDLYVQEVKDAESKLIQSQQTTSVAESQEGQQFRLTDPPTLPTIPSSPKRLKLSLGGLAGGILLGFALAFLAETRDSSFHEEKALSGRFKMPVVLSFPALLTPAEQRARWWKWGFECVAACVMILAALGGEFFIYRHG
jgi:polysaccharide biosynthesis transport protein